MQNFLTFIDYFYLCFVIICIIGILLLMLECFKPKDYVKQELEWLEQKKQEHIKWQVNRNLAARKRKDAISDLIAMFGNRDIKIDYESDSFYVIIKINKDALIEREVK